jgi:hypothetical protein
LASGGVGPEAGWHQAGATCLGFALSLKFFELHARFSESIDEFAQLEREGVASFERAFDELIAALDEKAAGVRT